MRAFASTGGFAVFVSPALTPDSAMRQVTPFLQMQTRQVFAYDEAEVELPERVDKLQAWKLETMLLQERNVQVIYRRKLEPCPAYAAPAATAP